MSADPTNALFIDGLTVSTPLPTGSPLLVVQRALVEGDEEVVPAENGVQVSITCLRNWPDEVLDGIGVQRFRGTLGIGEDGIRQSPRYRWKLSWNGRPGAVQGPWLTVDGDRWLLDEPLEEVVRLADHAAAGDRTARFRLVVRLAELSEQDDRIQPAARMLSQTILDANTLRLVPEPGSDVPVPKLAHVGPDGQTTEIDLDPTELRAAIDPCLERDGVVPLPNQRHIVVSAPAARNARLALAAPSASDEVRRQFAQNPLAFLPDESAFDDQDYSARVVGVGEAPSVPAAPPPSATRDWAADAGGLLLQSATGEVWVPGERLAELGDRLHEAASTGQPSVTWDGREIPATPAVLEAIDRILMEAQEPERSEDERRRPRILLIAENEVSLDWLPTEDRKRAVESLELPPLQIALQQHQLAGVGRLQTVWRNGGPGALLCDDMGLGKTLQALVFGTWAARQIAGEGRSAHDRSEGAVDVPLAIVAPPSLLQGWLEEIERRLDPSLLLRVLWGQAELPRSPGGRSILPLARFVSGGSGRGVVLESARVDLATLRAHRPDVLLIGYDTLRRLQFAVGQIRFGVLIADEAQEIKEPSSLKSRALRAMKYDFGLALTGTPIENTWRDLWTMCDFAVPARLGTLRDFQAAYPPSGDVQQLGSALADALRPVLVRRTRATALQGLPRCEIVRDDRVMPADQHLAYQAELAAHAQHGTAVIGLLQQLSRVSLHPRIRADFDSRASADAWAAESARTAATWDALRRYREEGAGVLVFVRSLAMQDTLQRALRLSFDLDHVGILNGALSQKRRHELVQRVREASGFRVLLVSPDVGGAGWNLQFASRAVLLERPWNPATEAQMIARIHRLGQDVPVEVVTPVATMAGVRTFDVVLDALLTDKRTLSESVLAPAAVDEAELSSRFGGLMDEDRPPPPPRASPPPPAAPPPPSPSSPVDLEALADRVIEILAKGSLTESELQALAGGARAVRR
ncbi:MAG: DEAD/DEAH box helicase, partial [Myxococcota bacterium]